MTVKVIGAGMSRDVLALHSQNGSLIERIGCRCLGLIVLPRAFQFVGKIQGRRAVLARCAVAQVHEVGEQVGNGVVPIRAGANLELPDCGRR
jgi:hypothetical protein